MEMLIASAIDHDQRSRRHPLALVSLGEVQRAERGSRNFRLNERSN